MKYVDEFRDRDLAEKLAAARSGARPSRSATTFHGVLRRAHPCNLPLWRAGPDAGQRGFVHGPGCPVCVLPVRRLDDAVELAERHGVILCTYGDMMRVPGTKQRSLIRAKADGRISAWSIRRWTP
jgi:hydrogenase expression/formation protein HypD